MIRLTRASLVAAIAAAVAAAAVTAAMGIGPASVDKTVEVPNVYEGMSDEEIWAYDQQAAGERERELRDYIIAHRAELESSLGSLPIRELLASMEAVGPTVAAAVNTADAAIYGHVVSVSIRDDGSSNRPRRSYRCWQTGEDEGRGRSGHRHPSSGTRRAGAGFSHPCGTPWRSSHDPWSGCGLLLDAIRLWASRRVWRCAAARPGWHRQSARFSNPVTGRRAVGRRTNRQCERIFAGVSSHNAGPIHGPSAPCELISEVVDEMY